MLCIQFLIKPFEKIDLILPIGPAVGLAIESLFVVGCITLDCIVVSVLMLLVATTGEIGFFLTGSWK